LNLESSLKSTYIIRICDIKKLNDYISTKLKDCCPNKKNKALLVVLRKRISTYLKPLNPEIAKMIESKLLLSLIKDRNDITLYSVVKEFTSCYSANIYSDQIIEWISLKLEYSFSNEVIRSFLGNEKPALVHPVSPSNSEFKRRTMSNLVSTIILVVMKSLFLDAPYCNVEKVFDFKKEAASGLNMSISLESGKRSAISSLIKWDFSGKPDYLSFKDVDHAKLKSFLLSRSSSLAEEPYFSAIMNAARLHDISPILMFAITGQEQGFAPTWNSRYVLIRQNPFNVYTSWENYNTSIADSSDIAARTIDALLETRPSGFDPFIWINSKYAEDDEWWIGTKSIFYMLEEFTSN
jgi:putative ABC transport system permease protein